ncbi:MAG TPA: primosomal replication protein N [Casimicrobiaceae bacterium]
MQNAGDNRLTLAATLMQRAELRYTPVGIPALECTLAHHSQQQEAGGERRVECEVHALAFGDVARALSAVAVGSDICCEGFLARRYRTGNAVALHITRFTNEEH